MHIYAKEKIMLSKEDLDRYLDSIPPIPEVLKACKGALEEGDMVKAADLAAKDRALLAHFQNIVNKPIFGFRNELKDARQIFGVLGIVRARQIFQSYFTLLLVPKKWEVFTLTSAQFNEIQAAFIIRWEEIMKEYEVKDEDLEAIVTLIPAAITVCESIFKDHIETISLIKNQNDISYETILYRLSGYKFFDIVKVIAQKWEFSDELLGLLDTLKELKNKKELNEKEKIMINLLLLINYEVSRPVAMMSGINDLFEIECDFDIELIENFYEIMNRVDV